MKGHPRLPWVERMLYWTYYITYIGTCLFELYRVSAGHGRIVGHIFLAEGWILPNFWTDMTDSEWYRYTKYLWETWKFMAGFVILSRLVEWISKSRKWLQRFQLALTLLWWCMKTDPLLVFIFLCVTAVFHLLSLARSRTALYLFALACYTCMNIDRLIRLLPGRVIWQLFYIGMPFYAHNLSFGLEASQAESQIPVLRQQGGPTQGQTQLDKSPAKQITDPAKHKKDDDYEERSGNWREEDLMDSSRPSEDGKHPKGKGSRNEQDDECVVLQEEDFSLEAHLHYIFYFPTLYAGPMMTFDDFRLQFKKGASQTWGRRRLVGHLLGVARVLLWVLLNELILELLHLHILNEQPKLLRELSTRVAVGIFYMLGQFFMSMYVVLFGMGRELAKFDGVHPPEGPKCVSYIYRYTRMWRWFDNGLYQFLKRYIFLPLGGSRAGMARRVLSSALCFSFILLWHGKAPSMVIWVALNFAEAMLEMLGGILSRTQAVKDLEACLSPQCVRRLHALLFAPLFTLSCISLHFFFGHSVRVGMAFVNRIFLTSTHFDLWSYILWHYTFVQVSMDVENYLQI